MDKVGYVCLGMVAMIFVREIWDLVLRRLDKTGVSRSGDRKSYEREDFEEAPVTAIPANTTTYRPASDSYGYDSKPVRRPVFAASFAPGVARIDELLTQ